ncbi:hypothetical protein PXD04_10440 [Methanosphaera sp. ISO3-F5]|uniref:hypothetical protein n=1 Tax=Methanosphaera sp. ISO3-F5 TaxID=1452353 RepID=UPI002B25C6ED|nr:hypothetical protein [Methanosphaera sp. ISO3-F5]WQH64109.1 hypothetical protein PXD04_10440 [Methanosphaera sp. ISO3-F5]
MKKTKTNNKPIVAVDYDGVLNQYEGWKGENHLPQPIKGVEQFLQKLSEEYNVVIFTCRDNKKVREWLREYELDKYVYAVTITKPQAVAYIDDRSIRYDGSYSEVLDQLSGFQTWWEEDYDDI